MSLRIPPELVDRIRESTDIVDLISGYVQLERKGGNYFGLCPFHPEKTPSFSVHPGKGIFHCFGCGAGGNAFTFLQLHDKLSFAEAARELAQRCGIPIPEATAAKPEMYEAFYRANEFAAQYFSRCLWEGKGDEFEGVRSYLKERDISPDLARSFRLGYTADRWDGLIKAIKQSSREKLTLRDYIQAGLVAQGQQREFDRFRGRLMFPILNLSGKVVAFGGRALKADYEGGKYVNSPETPIYHKGSILYGLHQAREQIRRKGESLVVEGYIDLMRVHESGFTQAVATSGTALTVEQAQVLRRFCRKVILVFDGDAAGSHASVRGGEVLLTAGLDVRVVGLPAEHDPDSFIRKEGASAFGQLLDAAMDIFSYRVELYRREGRLIEAPARTAVARELLESLVAVSDSLQQEMIARDLAGKMGLSAETFLRELAGYKVARKRRATSTGEPVPTTSTVASLSPKQRNLLEALIRWPELRAPTFAECTAQEFQEGMLRRIATRLEEDWIEGRETEGEELIREDTPMEDAAFISYALSQMEAEASPKLDRKAMRKYFDLRSAHDCLRDILTERLSATYRELVHGLEANPSAADQSRITKELKALKDRQKAITQKRFWLAPVHPSMDLRFPDKSAAPTPASSPEKSL